MHADQVELLVAVVKYKTLLKAPRLGLCSNWIASLTPESELSVWVKSGSFTFPESPVRLISMTVTGVLFSNIMSFFFRTSLWYLLVLVLDVRHLGALSTAEQLCNPLSGIKLYFSLGAEKSKEIFTVQRSGGNLQIVALLKCLPHSLRTSLIKCRLKNTPLVLFLIIFFQIRPTQNFGAVKASLEFATSVRCIFLSCWQRYKYAQICERRYRRNCWKRGRLDKRRRWNVCLQLGKDWQISNRNLGLIKLENAYYLWKLNWNKKIWNHFWFV